MKTKLSTAIIAITALMLGLNVAQAQTVTWTGETPAAGNFYIYNPYGKVYLAKTSTTVANISSATLFTLSAASGATIAYDDNGTTKYVYESAGIALWDTKNDNTWSFSNSVNSVTNSYTQAYAIYHRDPERTTRTRYIRYSSTSGIDYPYKNLSAANTCLYWQFISQSQYAAVYPASAINTALSTSNVTATRTGTISTATDTNAGWLVKESVTSGDCQQLTISGLDAGYYTISLYAKKDGDGTVYLCANDKKTAVSKTDNASVYTLTAHVTDGTLTVKMNASGSTTQNVYTAFKTVSYMSDADYESLQESADGMWLGEEVSVGSSYHIQSIKQYQDDEAAQFLTNYSALGDYKSSDLYTFATNGDGYSLANNGKYIIKNSSNTALTSSTSAYKWKLYSFAIASYGTIYNIFDNSKYYWYLNNGIGLKRQELPQMADAYYWRFISEAQFNAVYPTDVVTLMDGTSYTDYTVSIDASNVKTYRTADGTWVLTPRTMSGTGRYVHYTLTGLPQGTYDVRMNAYANTSATDGTVYAHFIGRGATSTNVGVNVEARKEEGCSSADECILSGVVVDDEAGTMELYIYVDNTNVTEVYSSIKSITMTASPLGSGDTFYLYNKGKYGYLEAGNAKGVQATIGHGIEITANNVANNKYTFNTGISNSDSGSGLYFDGSVMNNTAATNLTVEKYDDEYFIIKTADGKYVAADEQGTTIVAPTEDTEINAFKLWKFVTETERKAELANATINSPVDATFLVKDPGFGVYDTRYSNWTVNKGTATRPTADNQLWQVQVEVTKTAVFGIQTAGNVDAYQTVTNVPNGLYYLSAKAVQNIASKLLSENWYPITMYANTDSLEIPYSSDVTSASIAKTTLNSSTDYIVGTYVNVTDGTLKTGLYFNSARGTGYIWLDDIELSYYGENDTENTGLIQDATFDKYSTNQNTISSYWNVSGFSRKTKTEVTSSMNFRTNGYAQLTGTNSSYSEGYVQQTLTSLPAGAYRLSADVKAENRPGFLYAKIGDREQKIIFECSEKTTQRLTFIVPETSDVTVGFRIGSEYDNSSATFTMEADNFELVRIGDAEGTELSCQIVNDDLSLDNSSFINKTYGWKNNNSSSSGVSFSDYATADFNSDGTADAYAASVTYDSEDAAANSAWKTYDIYQELSGLPNGWYKLQTQAFYRDGESVALSDKQARSLLYASDSYKNISFITDMDPDATLYTTGGEGYPATDTEAALAFVNNPDKFLTEVYAKVTDGTIKIGVMRQEGIDLDWTVFHDFKIYYLYDLESADVDLSNIIRNYSFEEGNTSGWTVSNTADKPFSVRKVEDADGDGYDGNYLLDMEYDEGGTITINPSVSGLVAGSYIVSAVVAAEEDKTLTISANGTEQSVTTSGLDDAQTASVLVTIVEGDALTISLSGDCKFKADNFTITKAGGQYYLYNVDAGQFLVNGNTWNTQASLGTTGLKWIMMPQNTKKKLYKLSQSTSSASKYGNLFVSDDKAALYTDGSSNDEFKVVKATDGYYRISSALNTDTYIGWSGESDFTQVMPFIPVSDAEPRGTKWVLLSETNYNKYLARVQAAYATRMKAWPYIRSARICGIDISSFETVYNSYKSTASKIETALATLMAQLEDSIGTVAVDVSYKMTDANCHSTSLTGWTNSGFDYHEDMTHINGDVLIGGRFYERWVDKASSLPSSSLSQTVTLPAGNYILSCDGIAVKQGTSDEVTGVTLYATVGDVTTSVALSTPDGNPVTVTTDKFAVSADNTSVTVGVKVEGTNANWVAIDNFRLEWVSTYHSPSSSAYEYNEDTHTLVFTGEWSAADEDDINSLIANYGAGISVDFTDATLKSDINITDENPNVLVYYSETATYKMTLNNASTNVVKGYDCSGIVVTDGYDMYIARTFVAATSEYTRTMPTGSTIGTLCLPFDISSDSDHQLYTLGARSDEATEIEAIKAATVAAGTPCLFTALGTDDELQSVSMVGTKVDVNITTSTVSGNSMILKGTFKRISVGTGKDVDIDASNCYYIKKNKFYQGNGYFNISAFRAYIDASELFDDNSAAKVRIFGLRFNDEDEESEDLDTDATEISSLISDDEDLEVVGYYNMNGQSILEPQKGINIVRMSNGKFRKIFVK